MSRKIRIKTTLHWVDEDGLCMKSFLMNESDVDEYTFKRELSSDTIEGKLDNGKVVVLIIYRDTSR